MGPEKQQTILLTGESGSGKTRSTMHLLSFLSHTSSSFQVKNHIFAANSIFESFGNAQTYFNKNSSRFTKLTEVSVFISVELSYIFLKYSVFSIQIYFHPDFTLATIQVSYLLLESSRVYSQNQNETNFHIFYSLVLSAPKELRENLHLDITDRYLVSFLHPHKICDTDYFETILSMTNFTCFLIYSFYQMLGGAVMTF